ncbi:MAG: hypothetical protein JJE27_03410 [Thermoleophilia bacterium]|nr:hypothetical protein [Thermoleophilia bacterium]
MLALTMFAVLATGAADAGKRARTSASATKKIPSIVRVKPRDAAVGDKLRITGKNFVKGKKKMRVLLQRGGSKRRFTVRGTATSSKSMTFVVPDITADLPTAQSTSGTVTTSAVPAVYRIRLISKYGIGAQSKIGVSPTLGPAPSAAGDTSAAGDCDADGVPNSTDTDDDNDLLSDALEVTIGTDTCNADTDGDSVSDYYEYRVAFEFNGGPVLTYAHNTPYPNPLVPDSGVDHDGDGLTMLEEYQAWQSTGGRMDQFYDDASQTSITAGVTDDNQDVDHDLIPNLVELRKFGTGTYPLDWLANDTDGDGLCDGLDDQDHDGPPTPVAQADCTTPVPNNGASDTPPGSGAGDPGPLIDGDDNVYSNWYEWYYGGDNSWFFDPCVPSAYPISPYCPYG